MKRLFQIETKEEYFNVIVLILRLSVAALMITHGFPKLSKVLAGGEIQFADPFGMGAAFSLALVVFSEFFCSIFIGIGLGTRLATIPLIIAMIVAAFIIHGSDPIGKKELALLYLLIYLTLFIVGSRKFSIDYLLTKKNS
jgi:putative oxidoreductase